MTSKARVTWIVGAVAVAVMLVWLVASWSPLLAWFRFRMIVADPAMALEASKAPNGSDWDRALDRYLRTRFGQRTIIQLFLQSAVGGQDPDWLTMVRRSERAAVTIGTSSIADDARILIAWRHPDLQFAILHVEPLEVPLAFDYLQLLKRMSTIGILVSDYPAHTVSVRSLEEALTAVEEGGHYDARGYVRGWLQTNGGFGPVAIYLERR